MRFLRITNGYPRMSDSALLVKSKVIVAAMTGNAAFPTPTPTLASITALVTAFEEAIEKSANRDRQQSAIKRQARAALTNGLHMLGNYVLFISNNDEVIASSSGFSVSKVPQPRPAMDTPYGLKLKNGVDKGELKLTFTKVLTADSYVYEITPSPITPESVWVRSEGTKCKTVFTGLDSGKEYNCRVMAVGPKEQTATSEMVSRIAL